MFPDRTHQTRFAPANRKDMRSSMSSWPIRSNCSRAGLSIWSMGIGCDPVSMICCHVLVSNSCSFSTTSLNLASGVSSVQLNGPVLSQPLNRHAKGSPSMTGSDDLGRFSGLGSSVCLTALRSFPRPNQNILRDSRSNQPLRQGLFPRSRAPHRIESRVPVSTGPQRA